MKRIPDEKCVSICGLFCGACPSYPDDCHGCLSDYLRESCKECKNGFRDCAGTHNVTRCCDCPQFPCGRLDAFSKGPVIDGVNNHANVLADISRQRKIGVTQWLSEKMAQHTCPKCGELITWYEMGSHNCK